MRTVEFEPRPAVGFALSLVASILILLEGIVFAFASSILSHAGFGGASAFTGGLAAGNLVLGFILLVLSIGLYALPDAHLGIGIGILVLSVLSFFVGGGFVLGAILGIIGGILGIVFRGEGEEPTWTPSAPLPGGAAPYGAPLTSPSAASAAAPRWVTCPRCGQPADANRRFCPNCTSPLPSA